MAKRSKAKAKAKYRKPTKKAKKTYKKAKKGVRKTAKAGAGGPDFECFAEEQRVDEATKERDGIKADLDNRDLTAEQRKKLEKALRQAEARLRAAGAALRRCRQQH